LKALQNKMCYYLYQIIHYDNETSAEQAASAQSTFDLMSCTLDDNVCIYLEVSLSAQCVALCTYKFFLFPL